MTLSRYTPMIEAARRRPALWRLALGLGTVFSTFALWVAALIALRALTSGAHFVDAGADLVALGATRPAQAALYLMIVAGLGLGTFVAAGVWQRRSPRSLIGPGVRTLRHATIAAAVTLGFLGVLSLATLPLSEWPLRNQPLTTWLAWLPLGILALVFQTGAEEILFRGYLQSQLAARFRKIAVAIVVPSVMFGFAHFVPVFPTLAALTYVMIAALFGVLAADLTIRTGSIGAAWGFHFANNALAVLVVAPSGSITGLALWRTAEEFGPETFTSPLVTIEVLVLLASWALIRRALRV